MGVIVFPYRIILGRCFNDLNPILQRFHGEQASQSAHGFLKVTRGTGLLARILAFVMRLPEATHAVPVQLTVVRSSRHEAWTRVFGDRPLVSRQAVRGGDLCESIGRSSFLFDVQVVDGALQMTSYAFLLFGRPTGRWLAPQVTASECAADGGWDVAVDLRMPGVGRILQYSGHMVLQ
jgi:hypothetical protein